MLEPKPSPSYVEQVAALESVVSDCTRVSQACAGIPSPTGAHFYASVLFTALCTRAVSLATLVPHSQLSRKSFEHWDYGAAAGLVRSILELRIAFFYLCVEAVPPDEWQCRWNIFNLHDCTSRISLFQEIPESAEQLAGFAEQRQELCDRLNSNAFFLAFEPGRRRKLLHGQTAYLHSLEDIGVRAGVDVHQFRLMYKLFSSQVHGLPLAYYRMAELNRGRGVHSESEEGYTSLCISFALTLLVQARDEMKTLFPSAGDA